MFSLQGKVAVVTGAGSGIGAAIARRMAEAGARVVIADVNAGASASTLDAITAARGVASVAPLDVTDEAQCRGLIESLLSAHGRIDVLVNNAGVGMVGTILETEPADLDRLWAVNLKGMYHLCRAALPAMLKARAGSVVNIGSIASAMGMADRFAYTVTKHAVAGLTRALAMDCGDSGVRVNCICPGRVDTPFVQARLKEYAEPEKYMAQMVAPHPLKRLARPDEIAAAAVYLASDESAFVTGSLMYVDGGYTAGK